MTWDRQELDVLQSQDRAEVLSRFLSETVVVIDAQGRITMELSGANGLLGLEDCVGSQLFDHCHPDDLATGLEVAQAALETPQGWQGCWTARLWHQSGQWRPYGFRLHNELANPDIAGFVVRIREQQGPTATIDLPGLELSEQSGSLAELVATPILVFGSGGKARYLNQAAQALCDFFQAELTTYGFTALAHRDDRKMVRQRLAELTAEPGRTSLTFRLRPGRPDRPAHYVEALLEARGEPGRLHLLIATLIDVTDRHIEAHELRRRARIDPLTGLLNWGAITEILNQELIGDPSQVNVLYLDLDGFKLVNDTLGHDIGDELLLRVAEQLSAACQELATVGRIGGDEFAIVTVGAASAAIDSLVSAVTAAVAFVGEQNGFFITASIGSAAGRNGDVARDLLRRADHAMYDHKRWRTVTRAQ